MSSELCLQPSQSAHMIKARTALHRTASHTHAHPRTHTHTLAFAHSMARHGFYPGVCRFACLALGIVSLAKNNVEMFATHGGATLVLQTMSNFVDSDDIQSAYPHFLMVGYMFSHSWEILRLLANSHPSCSGLACVLLSCYM